MVTKTLERSIERIVEIIVVVNVNLVDKNTASKGDFRVFKMLVDNLKISLKVANTYLNNLMSINKGNKRHRNHLVQNLRIVLKNKKNSTKMVATGNTVVYRTHDMAP